MQDSASSESATVAERRRILVPSPIGVLGLEFEDAVAVGLEIVPVGARRQRYTPFADLKPSERSDAVDEMIGRLSEYLAGARRRLGIEYDLGSSDIDEFSRRVLLEAARIPFGRTRTYHELAAAIGRPGAYRQVLSSLIANPLPLIIPCHRVVPGRTGIGSYVATAAKKEWLLKMERRVLGSG
jgi:methylated-DNA-[protein]-cysteine S-methyltransferase